MGKHSILTEGSAVQALRKHEERIWYRHLTKEQRNELLDVFVENEEGFLNEFENVKQMILPTLNENEINKIEQIRIKYLAKEEKKAQKQENKKMAMDNFLNSQRAKTNSFLEKRGWNNPTDTSLDLFSTQNVTASLNSFLNSVGMMTTLKQEQQMQYNYYMTSQQFSFVQTGQNDEIIKQNNKIIEQNEKVIELLEKLTNKL